MRCSILVVTLLAAVALAGCASSGGQSSPSASHAALKSAADVRVCKGIKAYPKITTVAGSRKYATWLGGEAALDGVTSVFSQDLKAAAADLTAFLKGNGSQAQVGADANKLQALCGAYGVS